MFNFNFLFNFFNLDILITIYIYNFTKINRKIIIINFFFFYISNIINWILFIYKLFIFIRIWSNLNIIYFLIVTIYNIYFLNKIRSYRFISSIVNAINFNRFIDIYFFFYNFMTIYFVIYIFIIINNIFIFTIWINIFLIIYYYNNY